MHVNPHACREKIATSAMFQSSWISWWHPHITSMIFIESIDWSTSQFLVILMFGDPKLQTFACKTQLVRRLSYPFGRRWTYPYIGWCAPPASSCVSFKMPSGVIKHSSHSNGKSLLTPMKKIVWWLPQLLTSIYIGCPSIPRLPRYAQRCCQMQARCCRRGPRRSQFSGCS